jgi:hypothetical protein
VGGEGIYRLYEEGHDELFLIGHGQIRRAAEKARKESPQMRISSVVGNWQDHQLQEQVSDLIGLYMWQTASIPFKQYGGEKFALPRDPLSFTLLPLTEAVIPLLFWQNSCFSLTEIEQSLELIAIRWCEEVVL